MDLESARLYEGVARRVRKANATAQATAALGSLAGGRLSPGSAVRTLRDVQRSEDGQSVEINGLRIEYCSGAQFRRLAREILVEKCYEPLVELADQPTIIDAGANIGIATMFFADRWPGARIVSFEPDPDSFRCLERNVAAHGCAGVEIRNQALGREAGEAILFTSAGDGSLRASLLSERGGQDQVTTSVARLSDVIDELGGVDMLKMDIEGGEVDVIEELDESGALGRIGYLALEFHHNLYQDRTLSGALAAFERHGFRYQVDADRKSEPTNVQDVLVHAVRQAPAG